MSLSAMQASRARKNGTISWDEYIHCILARIAGIKHDEDTPEALCDILADADPFAYMFYNWCQHWADYTAPIQDTEPIAAVFRLYRSGTLEEVKSALDALNPTLLAQECKESLALLALQDRRPDVLGFCLDNPRFLYEEYFVKEAFTVDAKKDPETFEVMKKSSFGESWGMPPNIEKWNSTDPSVIFGNNGRLPVPW